MKTKLLSLAVFGVLSFSVAMGQYAKFPFDTDVKDANKKINATESAEGGISFVQDEERGSVVEFDGTSGYITLANTAFNFDAMTFNVWLKWDVDAQTWWVRVFDFGTYYSPDPGNHDVNYVTLYAWDKIRWAIHSDLADGGIDTIVLADTMRLKKWNMLTCVHGTEAAIYLNGVKQGFSAIGFKPSDLTYADGNTFIGKSNWADALFKGRMDNMAIYNKALTAEEVTALYNAENVSVKGLAATQSAKVYGLGNKLFVQLPANQSSANIAVYNTLGAEVLKLKANNNLEQINMNAGIYLVRVQGNGFVSSSKVVIK